MNIIDRVRNLMLAPKSEWLVIHGERMSIQEIYMQYLVLVAALPAGGQLLSSGRFGSFNSALRMAIASYLAILIGAYLCSLVVDYLAASFSSTRNQNNAFKLVCYSVSPSLLAGALAFVPNIGDLAAIAGAIYTIYLIYLGLPALMGTPEEKVTPYMIFSFIVIVVAYFIIGWLLSIFLGISFRPLGKYDAGA